MDTMLWVSVVILQVALVFGMGLIFMIYRRMTREGVEKLKSQVSLLEDELRVELRSRVDKHDARLFQIKEDIENLELKGKRNVELFSTVLHGFDFIVQGCKKALDSGEVEASRPQLDQKTDEERLDCEEKSPPLYESVSLEETN